MQDAKFSINIYVNIMVKVLEVGLNSFLKQRISGNFDSFFYFASKSSNAKNLWAKNMKNQWREKIVLKNIRKLCRVKWEEARIWWH